MFRNNLILLLNITGLICGIKVAHSSENIAHNKTAYQSSTYLDAEQYRPDRALDGNISTFSHCELEKNTLNWWKVDLVFDYYIFQIILTPRGDINVPGRMDYLFIGITNSPDITGMVKYPEYPLCRQSPYTAHPTENMSIPCRPNTPPGRYVVLQQPALVGYMAIAEVQIFGIVMGNSILGNTSCQGNYYGDKCDKYCNCDKGVKCNQQGICPNGCDVNWKGDHCDIKKYDDSQLVGCFEYNNSLPYELPQMNSNTNNDDISKSCIFICSGYGFTYAARKTADICICTNTMSWTLKVKNELCQYECSSQICQKFFYTVCPFGTYGYNCTLKCNCPNNGRCSYMEGSCEDGFAKGWTGDSCDCARDPTPAIIGGVIGSIAGLCLITAMVIIIVKCKKRHQETNSTAENYYFESESVKNTSNQTLYETPATTYVQDENKYKSLKPTEGSRMRKHEAVF